MKPLLRVLCPNHDSVTIAKVEATTEGPEYRASWPLPPGLGGPLFGTLFKRGLTTDELKVLRREELHVEKARTGRRIPTAEDEVRVVLDQIDVDEETLDGRLPAWCSKCRGVWWLELRWIRRSLTGNAVVRADGVLVSR